MPHLCMFIVTTISGISKIFIGLTMKYPCNPSRILYIQVLDTFNMTAVLLTRTMVQKSK